MDKTKIRQFRELNFPDPIVKESIKKLSIEINVSERSIRAYESGQRNIPKWYIKLITMWCELNNKKG